MTTDRDRDARILTAALRAPSAHNAQPWRIRARDGAYELHYDHHEYLPADQPGAGKHAGRTERCAY